MLIHIFFFSELLIDVFVHVSTKGSAELIDLQEFLCIKYLT